MMWWWRLYLEEVDPDQDHEYYTIRLATDAFVLRNSAHVAIAMASRCIDRPTSSSVKLTRVLPIKASAVSPCLPTSDRSTVSTKPFSEAISKQ